MQGLRFQWAVSNAATRLIMVNVGIFLLIQLPLSLLHLMNVSDLEQTVLDYLVLPGSPSGFIFRPWTLITHMFVHADLWHLAFNMLTLYFAAQLFQRAFDDTRFLNVYFVSGMAGALVFLLSVNVFPLFRNYPGEFHALGASAAILGVLIAISTHRPDDAVFLFGIFRIRLRWLALCIVLLDVLQMRQGNAGGHLAHLGGAAFGFFLALQIRKGRDLAAFWSKFTGLFRRRKSKLNVVHRRARSDEEYNLSRKERQQRMDAILDKITRSGYDSLTKEEKALLLEFSKDSSL